jgi:PII-like signaling protein
MENPYLPLINNGRTAMMTEVTIFLDEDDVYRNEPTHEYIMRYLLHHEIRGASMFEAVMGFGKKHHLHHPRKIGGADEESVMIIFIDEQEKVQSVLPHLKEVIREGLITLTKVELG